MNKILVNNQEELDAVDENYIGEIHIIGNLDNVTKFYKNAYVYVSGNAQIRNVYDNAQISNVFGNAQISYVSGNAQISYVSGNAQIRNVYGNAQIRNVYGNAQISNVFGNAQISYVSGNAQISYVYGNAQIRKVSDNAQISNVYGNASILHCSGSANIQTMGQNIISYNKSETKLNIQASSKTTIVILDEINCNFEGYKTFYPVICEGNTTIMYKSVHKLEDGRYVSDKEKTFEYVVGETKECDCDISTDDSCSYGLHVSHKMWALNFGGGWVDMALLEVSVPVDNIVVSKDCDGKVRTSKLTVIREVPKDEYYK